MKFLSNGSHLEPNRPFTRLSLLLSLLVVAIFWLTNILLFTAKMGFSYQSIVEYYLGNEEIFRTPVSYMGLLETTHAHLFAYALLLLLLNHLLAFTTLSAGWKTAGIVLTYGSGMLDIASGWLIVYVAPLFAWMKLLSFLTLQVSMAAVIGAVLLSMLDFRQTDHPNVG